VSRSGWCHSCCSSIFLTRHIRNGNGKILFGNLTWSYLEHLVSSAGRAGEASKVNADARRHFPSFQTRLGNCRIYTSNRLSLSSWRTMGNPVKSVLISRSAHYDHGILAGTSRIFTMPWEFPVLAFIAGNQSLQNLALSTVPRCQYVAKSFASSPVLP
jgi:hypothetical protein